MHPEFRCPYDDPKVRDLHRHFWVVAVISNHARFKSRYDLFLKFRDHVLDQLNVNLLTVECSFGDRAHFVTETVTRDGDREIRVQVQTRSWLWLKENLMNIGARHLPKDCKYVLFSDGDIQFCNPKIVSEIIHALQTYRVVQPFETCADLGPKGEILQVHQSFASCHREGLKFRAPYQSARRHNPWHPGYCMAFRYETFWEMGGMPELAILGAGDHHLCCALIGKVELSAPGNIGEAYKEYLRHFQSKVDRAVDGLFGHVEGTILHAFHGHKKDRQYVGRWQILVKHGYDPFVDVYHNSDDVLELSPGKSGLRDAIIKYFTDRNEDS